MSNTTNILRDSAKVLVMAVNTARYPNAVAVAVGDIHNALTLVAHYLESFESTGDRAFARKYLDMVTRVGEAVSLMPSVGPELEEVLLLTQKSLIESHKHFQTEVTCRMALSQSIEVVS
jgi:hypothetical protein